MVCMSFTSPENTERSKLMDGLFTQRKGNSWPGFMALLCISVFSGCNWLSVAAGALDYPMTLRGESANVVISGTRVYGTLAEEGFEVINLDDVRQRHHVSPPAGSESVDDIAIDGTLLFALDARQPGHLSVFSVSGSVTLVSGPVEVPVEPFSGVSAANGKVIVSGGTSSLTLFNYDREGQLSSEIARIDLGRGQPDVLLARDGKHAYVSTHHIGPYFGLTVLEVGNDSAALITRGDVDLDTYGFTDGGAKPANFPIEAAMNNNVVYVAHAKGLAVVSVQDPIHPRLLDVIDVGVKAVNVDVAQDVAAVVGSSPVPLLVLLDVSNPTAPFIKQTFTLPEGSRPTSVSIGENHIAVATHKSGVLIYQLHNWSLRPERSYQ